MPRAGPHSGRMTRLLAPVLTPDDLPVAELCGARLDGEVYQLADAWCPVDEVDGPTVRALAVGLLVPPRAIAERLTAAWVYGLVPEPVRHQFCVDHGARTHVPVSPRVQLREVRCAPEDTRVIAGLRVTTPLRTVIDLARSPVPGRPGPDLPGLDAHGLDAPGLDAPDAHGLDAHGLASLLAALLRVGGFADVTAAERLCRRDNLPHKRIALARLGLAAELLAAAPGGPERRLDRRA